MTTPSGSADVPIRIGLVGAGAMMSGIHAPCLLARNDVVIEGVLDPNADKRRELLRVSRGGRRFDSLDEMAQAGVDAVVVATPPSLHAQTTIRLLELGIPCLVEKPVGISREQLRELREARERAASVPVMTGFNGRFFGPYRDLRRRLQLGEAGELLELHLRFRINGSVPDWKKKRAEGGGVLLDLFVHLADLARWLTGRELTRVRSQIRDLGGEQTDAIVHAELDGGVPATFSVSLDAPIVQDVVVTGTEAELSADRYGGVSVEVRPRGGLGAIDRLRQSASVIRRVGDLRAKGRAPGADPSHERLMDRFIHAVRRGRCGPGDPTLEDGIAACEAAFEAEENRLA